jgi:2-dehydro-3-deoxygluconokinase
LTVTLDPGMTVSKVALDEIRALLPVIDILLPSLAEAQALAGCRDPQDCVTSLLAKGADVVALKLGRQGCLVGTDGHTVRVPGFLVEARDTTGAGDSFAAGLIAGLLGGLDWPSAAVLGTALGAMAAARVGGGTVAPTAQEVLTLLAEHQHGATHRQSVIAIGNVIDYVTKLATEPKKEGTPWWT